MTGSFAKDAKDVEEALEDLLRSKTIYKFPKFVQSPNFKNGGQALTPHGLRFLSGVQMGASIFSQQYSATKLGKIPITKLLRNHFNHPISAKYEAQNLLHK